MARVPQAEQRESLSPLARKRSNIAFNPDMFGAREGRAKQKFGAEVSRVSDHLATRAQQLQDRDDDTAVRKAQSQYDERVRAIMYDPDNGLYNRSGTAASGVTNDGQRSLLQAQDEVAKNLSDTQRDLFIANSERTRGSQLNGLAKYESVEGNKADAEATNALLNTSAQAAVDAFQVPEIIEENKAKGLEALQATAERQGWTPEQREFKESQYLSTLHKGVTERLLIDDPQAAKQYLADNQDEIAGDIEANLEKQLQGSVQLQQAQQNADAIQAQGGGPRAQLQAARKITDPEVRAKTEQLINTYLNQDERIRNIEDRRVKESVWSTMSQSQQAGELVEPWRIPGFSKMDGPSQKTMLDWFESKSKAKNKDSDLDVFTEFYQMSPEDLSQMDATDLARLQIDLNDTDYKSAIKHRTKELEDLNTPGKAAGTTTQFISAVMASDVELVKNKTSKHKRARASFQLEARNLVEAKTAEVGRALTGPEQREAVAPLLFEVRRPALFGFSEKSVSFHKFLGTDDDQLGDEFLNELRAAGRPITQANIDRYFNQWLEQQSDE